MPAIVVTFAALYGAGGGVQRHFMSGGGMALLLITGVTPGIGNLTAAILLR